MFRMLLKNATSSAVRAVACLVLAFSLVFFPPSATHAASGMHGDHHAVAAVSSDRLSGNDHGDVSATNMQAKQATTSTNAKDDASAGSCCIGICLSVVLTENTVTLHAVATASTYNMPQAQARSLIAHGFLRPPQFLI